MRVFSVDLAFAEELLSLSPEESDVDFLLVLDLEEPLEDFEEEEDLEDDDFCEVDRDLEEVLACLEDGSLDDCALAGSGALRSAAHRARVTGNSTGGLKRGARGLWDGWAIWDGWAVSGLWGGLDTWAF